MPDIAGPPDHLEQRHKRFLVIETIIGAVMNGMVPAVLIWWLRTPLPMPLLGASSLATSLIPATVLPGFGMPIVLSLVVRLRVRSGNAPALAWPLRDAPYLRRLPRLLVLRGLLAALVAVLIVPAAGLALMALLGFWTISGTGFIVYNLVHGIALGTLLLPTVLTLALADGARARNRKTRDG